MSGPAEESAVKVCVRVRPLIEREEQEATESSEPVQLYWKADTKSIHQLDDGTPTKSFSYDRVFSSSETTKHLYQDIAKPLVVSAVEGYNGTIFAYGQTSSGKTFTMMGCDLAPGVIPLSMEEVFQTIKNFPKKEFLLRVSYMEIYNETVTDLLVDSWKRKPLEVRETLNKNIYVADLTEELVTSPSQALAWIRKGEKNRHYGKTKMNQRSSRSHTIFRMILESREVSDPASGENSDGAIIVSHLNLVDLAGSERASQTGAEGARFKEGCNINRSLFTLAQVIKKLSDESQRGFTNYRDSKLTRILQNSLGGNAKTVIICTITLATLEETLSTLQFASTAKKMKNDPHVTEVSDDGALLKRYRNEIVDLKRRLQEVSSVTQTTVTEKETLSQLLQEKDQLQKEQQDRIKNLTKLLVTGSTFVPTKKMPKRRVTWGGKVVRLTGATECDVGQSDLSFAENFSRKRKADCSSMELLEEDEEFESRWEIPEESSYEMDMNQTSCVTSRSYGDSPQFVSPSGSGEKEAKLELQLEEERRLREEVLSRASSLEQQVEEERRLREEVLSRASSLEQQVEVLATEKREAWEEVERAEQRAEEQEAQLSAQTQERQEALEKVEMLEIRLADLEEQSHTMAGPHEQMKKEFEETIQLCETLVSDKEMVSAERDYLQQEVVLLLNQVSSLEKEKGFLSQELQERKEEEEFKALEEDCSKEDQTELHNEIRSLKSTVESWEVKCRDLESQLASMSEQLVKKSSWVEELETLQGKDLVQQVSQLRRSLDDAEGLSRDTRKDWAMLRSQNLSLKERDGELSSSHDQMVVEVSGLRSQLEKEKSRFRSMQTDLQKELHMAFEENTKLTALLDGKVPKNLLESVQLEGTIAALNKELAVCREAESELNKELTVCREVESELNKELTVLREAESELDKELTVRREAESELNKELTVCREAESELNKELTVCREAESALREELAVRREVESDLNKELTVCQEVESTLREELKTAPEQLTELTEQLSSSEQQRSSLEGQLSGLQQEKETLQQEKETLQQEKESLQQEKESLQEDKESLQEDKESLQQEKETLQQEKETLQEDKESLQEDKESLQEEKETLQQEKETLQQEKERLQQEKESLQENMSHSELSRSTEEEISRELQEQLKLVSAELESVRSERDCQSSISGPEEVERLVSEVSALSQEKEQLQGLLEALREEKNQLKMDLQENVEMMIENQDELRTALEKTREQKEQIKRLETLPTANQNAPALDFAQIEDLQNHVKALQEELESVRSERDCQSSISGPEEVERLASEVSALSQEREQLQGLLEALREEKNQLREEMEDKIQMILQQQQQPGICQQPSLSCELGTLDQHVMENLQATLQSVTEEKDRLERELQLSLEKAEEMQGLLSSLQEQLKQVIADLETQSQEYQASLHQRAAETQGVLEVLQQELQEERQRNLHLENVDQERTSLLDQQVKALREELESVRSERDCQSSISGPEEVERLVSEVSALSQEREQLQGLLEALREEKNQLREEMEDKIHMMQAGLQHSSSSQQQTLQQEQEAQTLQQIQRLEEDLESVRTERNELKTDLQENVELMIENQEELRKALEKIRSLKAELVVLRNQEVEESSSQTGPVQDNGDQLGELQHQIQNLSAELESVRSERDCQSSISGPAEVERLVSEVSALSREREQLQGLLDALREEKNQLREEMEDKIHMISSTQEQLNLEQRTDSQKKEDLLQQQIQQLEIQLAQIRKEMSGLQEELAPMEREKTRLQEEVARRAVEKTGLQEELVRRADEKTGLQEEVARMQEESRTFQEELARMAEDKTGLQEEVAHMEEERRTFLEEGAKRAEESRTFQEEVAHMVEEKTGLQEELAHMEEEKTGLQEELAHMEEEKTGLQEEVARRVEESRTFQEEVARRLEESRTFQEEVAHIRKEKTGLQEQVARMVEESRTFQEEVARMAVEKTGLQEEVARMAVEKTGLQEEVARMAEEKTGLQEEVTRTAKEKTGLQEEVTRVAEENRSLQKEVQLQQEKVQQLEEVGECLQEEQQGVELAKIQKMQNNMAPHSDRCDVVTTATPEDLSSRLKDTTRRLKDSAESFQLFISRCSSHSVAPLDKTLLEISVIRAQELSSLPKALLQLYNQLTRHNIQAIQGLGDTTRLLKCYASDSRRHMEELVHSDLAVLEQRRLQDLLLSSTVAPDDDLHALWEHRLTVLLDRRELHLQRMSSLLEMLEERLGDVPSSLAAQLGEMSRFLECLRAVCSHTPLDLHTLEDLLTAELKRSSTAALLSTNTVQAILKAQGGVWKELEALGEEATAGLEEERSKTSILLQALDNAPLKTEELQLLRDNQQLLLQLQNTQNQLTALRRELDELEEVSLRSTERLSNHKKTTQLLQTELQDACAQINDKDTAIQTLRSKLRLSEEAHARTQMPPSVVEVEELRNKVVKLEVEVTSATSKHQEEVKSLTSLLNIKEESLRKLRETLRKSQQEQQESFLQGEELYCRLTNPRGSSIQTSGHLERSKLEEEIRVLHLKVKELQSLVSSQQAEICSHGAEISKWKSRAFNLKEKNKVDRPQSPTKTTPSKKRLLPHTVSDASHLLLSSPKRFHGMPRNVLESPRKKVLESPLKVLESPRKKVLESPRKVLESPMNVLDSQKTTFLDPPKFFGSSSSSGAGFENLSMSRPKQFFDNSNLGIDPEISCVPSNTDDDSQTIEEDASVSVDKKEEWWPLSPKQEEICKTQ